MPGYKIMIISYLIRYNVIYGDNEDRLLLAVVNVNITYMSQTKHKKERHSGSPSNTGRVSAMLMPTVIKS